nr:MAG TPA: hypothetical protein [Caudoviricetes sp.]
MLIRQQPMRIVPQTSLAPLPLMPTIKQLWLIQQLPERLRL